MQSTDDHLEFEAVAGPIHGCTSFPLCEMSAHYLLDHKLSGNNLWKDDVKAYAKAIVRYKAERLHLRRLSHFARKSAHAAEICAASLTGTSLRHGRGVWWICLLYTSPSPRAKRQYRFPASG